WCEQWRVLDDIDEPTGFELSDRVASGHGRVGLGLQLGLPHTLTAVLEFTRRVRYRRLEEQTLPRLFRQTRPLAADTAPAASGRPVLAAYATNSGQPPASASTATASSGSTNRPAASPCSKTRSSGPSVIRRPRSAAATRPAEARGRLEARSSRPSTPPSSSSSWSAHSHSTRSSMTSSVGTRHRSVSSRPQSRSVGAPRAAAMAVRRSLPRCDTWSVRQPPADNVLAQLTARSVFPNPAGASSVTTYGAVSG